MRLEGHLEPGTDRGPGNGADGSFRELGVQATLIARSTGKEIPGRFRFASNGAGEILPLPDGSWVIQESGGRPTAAVFELESPVESEAGFTIRIHHAERFDCHNIGRFRWLVCSDRRRANADWISSLITAVDDHPWRTKVRNKIRERDLAGFFQLVQAKRDEASSSRLFARTISDALLDYTETDICSLLEGEVECQPIIPEQFQLAPGVVAETLADGQFALRGATADRETVDFVLPDVPKSISALRVAFVPALVNGWDVPLLGRKEGDRCVQLMEMTAKFDDDTQPLRFEQAIQQNSRERFESQNIVDGDPITGVSLWDARQPAVINSIIQEPTESTEKQSLRVRLSTAGANAVGRFQVFFSADSIDLPTPRKLAVSLLEELVDEEPGDYWSLIALSEQLRARPERRADAYRYATAAIALRDDKPCSYASALRSFPIEQVAKDSARARELRRLLARLRQLDPRHRAIEHIVDRLVEEGNLQRPDNAEHATYLYRLAIELGTPRADRYRDLAQSLSTLNPKLALESARMAVEVGPDNIRNYTAVSNVYDALGDYVKSAEWTEKAVAIDPDSSQAHFDFGLDLLSRKKFDEASEQLLLATELDPDNYYLHYHAGLALQNAEKLDEAIAQYQRALELNPLYSSAAINLQTIHWSRGEYEQALEVHRRRAALDRDEFYGNPFFSSRIAGAKNSLALMLSDLGRMDECISELEEAIELQPDPVHITNLAVIETFRCNDAGAERGLSTRPR